MKTGSSHQNLVVADDDSPEKTSPPPPPVPMRRIPIAPVRSRPIRAVALLAEQVEHSSAGARKSAATSHGRLGEAAVRHGLFEVALEHVGILGELHMDTFEDVRKAAIAGLLQVQEAASSHSSTDELDCVLYELLRHHRTEHCGSTTLQAAQEFDTTKLRRASSDGALRRLPLQAREATTTILKEGLCQPRRYWARPRCHHRLLMEEVKEVEAILRKPSRGPVRDEEYAWELANKVEQADAGGRSSAAIALGRLGTAAAAHTGILRDHLTDHDSFVRAACAVSLRQLEPKPRSPIKGKSRRRSPVRTNRGRPASVASSRQPLQRPSSAGPPGGRQPKQRPSSAGSTGGRRRAGLVPSSVASMAWSDTNRQNAGGRATSLGVNRKKM